MCARKDFVQDAGRRCKFLGKMQKSEGNSFLGSAIKMT